MIRRFRNDYLEVYNGAMHLRANYRSEKSLHKEQLWKLDPGKMLLMENCWIKSRWMESFSSSFCIVLQHFAKMFLLRHFCLIQLWKFYDPWNIFLLRLHNFFIVFISLPNKRFLICCLSSFHFSTVKIFFGKHNMTSRFHNEIKRWLIEFLIFRELIKVKFLLFYAS